MAGRHSLGGRDVRTVLEVMVSVTTEGTSNKKKTDSTHSEQVFSPCCVFLIVNKNELACYVAQTLQYFWRIT